MVLTHWIEIGNKLALGPFFLSAGPIVGNSAWTTINDLMHLLLENSVDSLAADSYYLDCTLSITSSYKFPKLQDV